ncbi:TetR family transcriptional regulator [Actinocorallia herbida]|uniref:TetR family transcriptional regulator n=1 Tax=Actinocorallia herbida TaxID=58109 RepID=A0A3N1CUP4_9ACTN|nr:TetR family transcriptional regulator [Actinocorallia herbida]
MRLRAEDRRRMILRAAGDLFIARGFAGVTMEDVIAAAGGSKSTIYQQFSDKTDLFRAAVESLLDERSEPLRTFVPSSADLARTLVELGRDFATVALSPESIALHRLVSAEAERVPGLGEAFFDHGPRAGQRVLGGVLQAAADAGLVAIEDPILAAAQLYQAMLGDVQMRLLTDSPQVPTDEEIERSIAYAVRVFLHGVALRPRE